MTILPRLTRVQREVLDALNAGVGRAELARRRGVKPPSITQIAAVIERKGYKIAQALPRPTPARDRLAALLASGLHVRAAAAVMRISHQRAYMLRRDLLAAKGVTLEAAE